MRIRTFRWVLMGALSCFPVVLGGRQATAASDGPAGFRVAGRRILGPDGQEVRLRGFNVLWWIPATERDAVDVKKIGANFVRYMFGYDPKGRFDPARVDVVLRQVRYFTRQGLWVIPTVHSFKQPGKKHPWNSEEIQSEFLEMWTYLVEKLKDEPMVIAWEPMNEPHDVEKPQLRAWYQQVVAHFRKLDPARPIVVEGVGYSWPAALDEYLKLDDPNIIYSFHMYGPFDFTHQEDQVVEYPGKYTKDTLEQAMAPAWAFGDEYNVPVYCGEFGAVTRAPGHCRWLEDVSAILEANGSHWAHWAWAAKAQPGDDSFDVNTRKKGIYNAMVDILAKATRPAPRILSAPQETVFSGSRYSYRVATGGNPVPRVRVSGLPRWLEFDGVDTILGVPEPSDAGASRRITVTARNAAGQDMQRFRVTVIRAVRGSGTGLRGEYFGSVDLTGSKLVRTDAAVDFDWPGAPDAALGPDRFSVRWTGKVQAQLSETYTFHTITDDGVRLWVDGNLLVDEWNDQGSIEYSADVELEAGRKYEIRMEYYEATGGARATLMWSSPLTPKQVIPKSQLYPGGAAGTAPSIPDRHG